MFEVAHNSHLLDMSGEEKMQRPTHHHAQLLSEARKLRFASVMMSRSITSYFTAHSGDIVRCRNRPSLTASSKPSRNRQMRRTHKIEIAIIVIAPAGSSQHSS